VAGLESKQIQEQIQAHEENFLPILKNEISDLS